MNLPYSSELNIGYLSRLFDNTSNCYKFFWFQAILRKVDEGNTRLVFSDLIHEMIADAWYMVTEYHLRLASVTDHLEESVKRVEELSHFASSEKREKIVAFLQNSDDKELLRYKQTLILNVPYRLQVPFYDEIYIPDKTFYGSKEKLTQEINRQKRLIYYFHSIKGLETEIEIDPAWADYLKQHKEILTAWMQLKLIHYLEKKNPAVPGIAEKLVPPVARDLKRVRNYWNRIILLDPGLQEIYGHVKLAEQPISVDHFVPWQYVAHDELWNLHPTTRQINSSKNNGLPSWDLYFGPLADLEYHSLELCKRDDETRKLFEQCREYHVNNDLVRQSLYGESLSKVQFVERLEKIVHPVYEAAKNSGFREWEYRAE